MKLAEIFSNYYTVRQELMAVVERLTPDQLAFTAPNHPNSIARLLVHIAETEYGWLDMVALKKETVFDSSRFEKISALPEILKLLEYHFDEFSRYLENEDLNDWDRVFYALPESDVKVSKRWLVWHVVEHQARHRGQIFMLMRMQNLEVPNV
ncbi:MAG: DinB family protein [candidate division Zixibacteria bacterium]|nr:DinB family protein [candidate division Zixibacteria bacterium]MDD5425426.1 DinB family protein [candidate division Zixibacteria bacterium]